MLRIVLESESESDIPEGLHEKLQAERVFLVSNMRLYGGHFVVALSEAILRSDANNYERLKEAFPELWEKYSNIGCHSDRKEDQDGMDHDNGSE